MNFTFFLSTLFGENLNHINPLLSNRKQRKIRHRLKVLSNHVLNYRLISMKWAQFGYFEGLLFVFSHGIISSVCFSMDGTINNVYHEKFLHSKLASSRVCSIEIQDQYILISYIEPYLTYISLNVNFDRSKKYFKFKLKNNCPIKTVNLDQSDNRLSKRNVIISEQHAIFWWNTNLFSKWSFYGHNANAPNLVVFSLNTLNIVTSETIDGEIIKVGCFKFLLLY